MTVNIAQLTNILGGLSDDQLQLQMKNPSAGMPQYLILSEMQRRQRMRAEAQPTAPAPVTTVADDIQAQNGVAALPQMATGEEGPAEGVAAFAGGGSVFPPSGGPSGTRTKFADQMKEQQRELAERIKDQFFGSIGWPGARDDQSFGEYAGEALSSVGSKINDAYQGSALQKGLGSIDAEVGRSQSALLNGIGAADQYAGDVQRYHYGVDKPKTEKPQVVDLMNNVPDAKLPPKVEPVSIPGLEDVPAAAAPRAARAGIAAVGAAKGIAPTSNTGTLYESMKAPERIPNPALHLPNEYTEQVNQNMPDNTERILATLDAKRGDTDKDRKQALNMALMEAGLGIMSAGGKTGSLLGAIGEGGIGGLQSYTRQMGALRERGDKLDDSYNRALLQQDEMKGNRYKVAADMANQMNTREVALHGQDVQERRADMQMQQQDRHFDIQAQKMDQQMQLEREKMNNAVRIANIGASARMTGSGSAGGAGGVDRKTVKDALSQFNNNRQRLAAANPYNPLTANGKTPEQWMNEINQAAFRGIGGVHQQALRGYGYDFSAPAAPQQQVLKLGTNGFYE